MQILNVDFMLGIGTAVGIGTLVWLLWRTRTLGELTETVPDIPFGGSYTKNSDNDPRLPDMADYRWVDPPRSSIASAEKKPRRWSRRWSRRLSRRRRRPRVGFANI